MHKATFDQGGRAPQGKEKCLPGVGAGNPVALERWLTELKKQEPFNVLTVVYADPGSNSGARPKASVRHFGSRL